MPVVRFLQEVENDLREAIDWYEAKRAGLGHEFADEYWSTIDRITNQPLAYAVSETGLRGCRLSRFPYVVHFRCHQDDVLIIAVMFGGRETSAWIDRD